MMSLSFTKFLGAVRRVLAPALAAVLTLTVVACGGGGYLESPVSLTEPSKLPFSAFTVTPPLPFS